MPLIDTLQRWLLPPWHWDIASLSISGAVRADNEDSVAHTSMPHGSIAVLADGVGGRNAGEVAAQFVCDGLVSWFTDIPAPASLSTLENALDSIIRQLHRDLYHQSLQYIEQQGMASTLVVAVQYHRQALLAWVGDSRIYLFRKGKLLQLSEDHSIVQKQLRMGLLEAEDVANHPHANRITSAIGGQARLQELGMRSIKLREHDLLVLVSDGISDYMSLKQIEEKVSLGLAALIDASQQAQSTDNCSAVFIKVKG